MMFWQHAELLQQQQAQQPRITTVPLDAQGMIPVMPAHAVPGVNEIFTNQGLRVTSPGRGIRVTAPPPMQQLIRQPPLPLAARHWIDEREVMTNTMFASSPTQVVHIWNVPTKENTSTEAPARREEEHRQQARKSNHEDEEGNNLHSER